MRGVLRASLASASVGAQRFHARGHRLRLGLRLRVRSELAGHTLAAIWLRGLVLRVDWRRGGLALHLSATTSLSNRRRSDV
jgi:hypothetical protein